jgi:hypothetical protein
MNVIGTAIDQKPAGEMGAIVSAVALRYGRKKKLPHYDLKAATKVL